ncbi:hypothetical protein CJF30_00002158 [Rutstroemia sp. NJR-2017a BBW]|nr:hypothetical protein CJF30_00002158 [Rutstroemia sp. NJR-2017a BBW]
MAAFVKAINAKIRSNPAVSYVCSTHFWGPVSNFGIPIAAVMDTQKSPELYLHCLPLFQPPNQQTNPPNHRISGKMTAALCIYSATFMRYALAVTPMNPLLFLCHFVNEGAQLTQGYRWMQYNKWGGKEEMMKNGALESVKESVQDAVKKAEKAVGK